MELSFSRGFSHGFLDGNNHKVLVRGDYAKKRGIFLGRWPRSTGPASGSSCSTSVKPGDGVVFDGDDGEGVPEQGGRVYEVVPVPGRPRRDPAWAETRSNLTPAIHPGQGVWKTDDPELTRHGCGRRTRARRADWSISTSKFMPRPGTARDRRPERRPG